MANINPFSTQITNTQPGVAAGTGAATAAGKGAFSAGAGMAFWDFMLMGGNTQAQIQAGQDTAASNTAVQQASLMSLTAQAKLKPDATVTLPGEETDIVADMLSGDNPEALAELALFLDSADKDSGIEISDLRVERIQKRLDTLNKLVNHLTNGMPAAQKNDAAIETLVARLDQHIEKLEVHLRDLQSGKTIGEDGDVSLLIAMGMTPAQLAKMSQRIEDVEKKLGRELTVEDLVAGVANIVPPPQDQNKMLLPVSAKANIDPTDIPSDAEPSDDLAAQLNGLTVGVGNDGSDLQLADGAEAEGGDKRLMRGLDLLQKLMTGAQNATADGSQKAAAMMKSGFSTLLNFAGVSGGDIALPSGWYQNFADGIDFTSFDIQAGLPMTTAAQAAHVTTAVQQAGQAHPATHLVSAQMTKAAQEGSQTMTIQLDPPELGRVDVRLEFGPEKTVKAHLVVEKVETLHMLQRDAAFLDRALTNAGLDTASGSSLSFELAQDRAFDHGNGHNGRGGTGDDSHRADADTDIIQSTMTWQVDPDTGHVRYNILA